MLNTDLRITILGQGVDVNEGHLEVLIPPRREQPLPAGDQSTGMTLRGDYREVLELLESLGPRFRQLQPRHVSLKLLVDAPAAARELD